MHIDFASEDMINKHVRTRQLHERPLQLEQQIILEKTSVQKVIHAEAFNEVCEALNKVYDAQQTDWDLRIPVVRWAYRTTCKKLMAQTPPRLEYGENVVIPIEYSMPSLCIITPIDIMVRGASEEGITQLTEAEHLGPEEEI